MTKIFNPADFAPKAEPSDPLKNARKGAQSNTNYPLSGNSTRD